MRWSYHKIDDHAVNGGFHPLRQSGGEIGKIHRVVHMGQNGPFGTQMLNPGQHHVKMSMTWMGAFLQAVDDPDIQSFKGLKRYLIETVDIG